MDSRQLRYFATLAEACHFGRAAEQLHVTPSAISQAIRQLEADLDTILLHRSSRQVTLTEAGRWLYAEAGSILARMDSAEAGIRRFSAGSAGSLRIGMPASAAFAHLPRIARNLKKGLAGVELSITVDMLTPQQCEALREGRIDLGFLRPPPVGADILTIPFAKEPLLLAVPDDHPLAHRPLCDIGDLRRETWVAYGSGHSLVNDAATRLCRAAGFEPERTYAVAETSVLLALVAAGMGIAMVPGGVRSFPIHGVVFKEVPGAEPLEIHIAFRPGGDSPVVDRALRLLTDGRALERRNHEPFYTSDDGS